jgi:hypothetical protein
MEQPLRLVEYIQRAAGWLASATAPLRHPLTDALPRRDESAALPDVIDATRFH